MKQTSFGNMKSLFLNENINLEYMVFEKEGRAHQHDKYESFFVISGKGKVINGDQTYLVQPGDLVIVPPHTDHWMVPEGEKPIEGFLWHHRSRTELKNS